MDTHFFDQALHLQRQAWDEGLKFWNRMLALPNVAEQAARVQVATTPHDVVYEKDELQLYHYRPERPAVAREPVLVCYALVNRPYILDLQPERSVIRRLLAAGLDVYLIDWGVPTAADHHVGLQEYIAGSMRRVADIVRQRSGQPTFTLMGYCMGGTMSTIFTTLFPDLVKNLVLMAAPIDFSGDEALLHLWTKEENCDVDRLIDAYGNCPATFLQATFQLMKPVQNFIEKYTGFVENMHDEQFLQNFFAMEKWTNDNIPVAGETFREFVKCLYQRNQLVRGEFQLGGETVRLERITCPVLLLAAEYDHLVRPESTFGLIPHIRSTDIKQMSISAGHVGLAVSGKAHKQFWPAVADWIVAHSTPVTAETSSPPPPAADSAVRATTKRRRGGQRKP